MHTTTTAQRANNVHRRNHGKTRKTKEHNEEGKNNQETQWELNLRNRESRTRRLRRGDLVNYGATTIVVATRDMTHRKLLYSDSLINSCEP